VTGPRVVQLGDPSTVKPVRIVDGDTITAVPIGGGSAGPMNLDDLTDVEGAAAATAGQVLTKTAAGPWSPATVTGEGPPTVLSYRHQQDSPSTVWLITHGLPFEPAGVEVFDHLGARHHPTVSYPSAGVVRLDFNTPVRGIARLS
jgi:hypothetical protein